jgi:2-polyprenyl-6-methoxyphenol hydroxylase-like FAD-dependent oxidoreductase
MAAARKVGVVGGGLAGLSAAIVLARLGVEVEIAEISSELRPLGTGIGMSGLSVRALGMVDETVLRQCLSRGASHRTVRFGTADGQIRQQISMPLAAGPQYPAGFGIMRPVFWELLAGAAREAGARIKLSVTATAISQDSDGATVSLSDGSEVACDLVIGADGLWSKVREMAFPHAPAPSFTGQTTWRATVPRHPEISDGITVFAGPRGRVGCNPVSADEMYVFMVENTPNLSRPAQEQWPALLRDLLSDYRGVIARAREQVTDPARIDRRQLHALLLPAPWHFGRVLLIGDAVHTPTPHLALGAGLALEDAVVLGEVLDSQPDLASALTKFSERRWERCRLAVENSVQLGEWDKNPDDPNADTVGLTNASFAALAAPF